MFGGMFGGPTEREMQIGWTITAGMFVVVLAACFMSSWF